MQAADMDAGMGLGGGFGGLLRLRRAEAGYTQEELAERSGLSVRAITDMERGHTGRPYRRSVQLLADALMLAGQARDEFVRAARAAQPLRLAPAPVPRHLPAPVAHFAGRTGELKALTELVDRTAEEPRTVVISAIGGTAGVGKTALAVHWAHQVACRFPDGQLYLNLRGFDPSGTPVVAADAVRRFLHALQVPARQIPSSPEAQEDLYRSLLAGRRMLIVLDNARDAGQVRPLLPGGPDCLVLVTSRSQLTSLVAAEGAHPVTLDVLSPAEACELLERRLGSERIAAESEAVAELTGLCARLPLALAITAARAAVSPRQPLAALVSELRDVGGRLDALDAGEAASSVRAVFSWSYRQLPAQAARMFRLLGVHPGPDITATAAASLAAIPFDQARQALSGLTTAHLLAEHVPGRFTFHDLLRAYAVERAAAEDSPADRRAAMHRIFDHYLHTACAASRALYPSIGTITPVPAQPGVAPEGIADAKQALAWFEAEWRVLLAAVTQAADAGFDTHAWQLPQPLSIFLNRRGHWHDYAATQRTALTAAQRAGDQHGQALASHSLGYISMLLGSYRDALRYHGQALEWYRQLGDRTGQGRAHLGLGGVCYEQRRYREALGHSVQALDLYRSAGDRAWQATALNNIGWFHAMLGDYQQALARCQQALALQRELGNRQGEGAAWDSLGYTRHHLGQHLEAVACYQNALVLARENGNRLNEADVLFHLGGAYDASGQPRAAQEAWQQALIIFVELRHPRADEIRARLQPGTPDTGPEPAGPQDQ